MKCDSKKLRDFKNSTLTDASFCKANNLVYSQFLYLKKSIKNKSTKTHKEEQS